MQDVDVSVEAAKPVIVMPRLVYFHEAEYPEAARKQKLEAEVLLKLVIQVDGSVGSVEVVQGAGLGLDEAAAAAAQRFIFTPAQRDGVAVAAAIQYLYKFSSDGAQEGVELGAVPTSGNLEGTVLISGDETPVAGVLVSATDAAGKRYEVRSDALGRWVFAELPPGKYQLQLEADGFEALAAEEEVLVGEATLLKYRLSPASEGIDILVKGERPAREVTRRTLVRREISRVPGTGGDALRSLQSLPGVARPPGLAGLLIVRGSAPEDTNTFIDGALVPLVYHFGGLSSVVPTELLDKIDFYPGNFSAKYGRVMGGVVDVALRSPDTQCTDSAGQSTGGQDCFHGLAQVDLIDTRLLLQGPLSKNWSFAVAGRRSWVDAWLKPVLEEAGAGVTAAPVYFDYQVILERKATDKSRFRAQFYGSDDALKILINNPAAQEPAFGGQIAFATAFYRGQLTYERQLSDDWDLFSTLAIGRDRIKFSLGSFLFDLDSYPIELRSELSYKLMRGVKITGGLDFLTVPVEVRVRAPEPPRDGEPQPGPFTNRPILETFDDSTAFRPAWYMEAEVQPTRRLLLVPGARVDYARDSGHADFDPRFNARFTLFGPESTDAASQPGAARRTVLKGGIGLYSQAPQFQETDEVFGTVGIESNRSLQSTIGVEQELTQQLDLSVEGYYKDLSNLVSRAPTLNGYVYNNQGSGSVVGLETLLKYKPDQRFFGWVAYTLSRSVRRNAPAEPEYHFQFDQTHILTLLGSYRLGNGWEVGARYRLVSGNMTTDVAGALYSADAGAYTPLQDEAFGKRLPLFHQLDLRAEKNWRFDAWRLVAYLDVWNAYNNAAVEGTQYNFDFTRKAYQTGLPFIPSFGLRGEF